MTKPLVNPIIKKDLKVSSRSMKFAWSLFAYEAILAIIFLLTMLIMNQAFGMGAYNNIAVYDSYVSFFPVIGITQLIIIALIVPVITASSISGERERKTMDVLLTTTISPWSIIIGKIFSAVIRVMIYVFASIPLMAISFIVGGLSWITLFEYILLAFIFAIFAGSIGVLCSSLCRKSIVSIIISYVIYVGIYGFLFVPTIIVAIVTWDSNGVMYTMLLQLLNPLYNFIIFFVGRMSNVSVSDSIVYMGGGGFLKWIYSTNVWLVVSSLCQLGISVLFVFFATLRIRPREK